MASAFQNAWQLVHYSPSFFCLVTISIDLLACLLACSSSSVSGFIIPRSNFVSAALFCRTALEAEKELLKNLAEKEPTYTGITHFLSELVIFLMDRLFLFVFLVARSARMFLRMSLTFSGRFQISCGLPECYTPGLRNRPFHRRGRSLVGCASQNQYSVSQVTCPCEWWSIEDELCVLLF